LVRGGGGGLRGPLDGVSVLAASARALQRALLPTPLHAGHVARPAAPARRAQLVRRARRAAPATALAPRCNAQRAARRRRCTFLFLLIF